jgi:hypothetical protein
VTPTRKISGEVETTSSRFVCRRGEKGERYRSRYLLDINPDIPPAEVTDDRVATVDQGEATPGIS